MLTKENLLSVISFVSGLSDNEIRSQNRARVLVLCRHAYYYIARQNMGLKLAESGSFFGNDHTTVIHGINKVKDMISIGDEITCQFIEQLDQCIRQKYLIPTMIMVAIPSDKDSNEVIEQIKNLGCAVDVMKKGFDA
jgi:uncharacterized protein YaaQ